jgi:[CysO sulfur-carrier protein]-thiocarboxylate-dependent cysteine synthase
LVFRVYLHHHNVRLWAKLEDRNPTGSIKDRAALSMLDAAEASGQISSQVRQFWNQQVAIREFLLRWLPKVRGYHLICVMPENTSPERRQLLEMWGAKIISSPAAGGSNEAVRVAKELISSKS